MTLFFSFFGSLVIQQLLVHVFIPFGDSVRSSSSSKLVELKRWNCDGETPPKRNRDLVSVLWVLIASDWWNGVTNKRTKVEAIHSFILSSSERPTKEQEEQTRPINNSPSPRGEKKGRMGFRFKCLNCRAREEQKRPLWDTVCVRGGSQEVAKHWIEWQRKVLSKIAFWI